MNGCTRHRYIEDYGAQVCIDCGFNKDRPRREYKERFMRKQVMEMQEFQEGAQQEGITVKEFVDVMDYEALGAVLGYWDGGDNGWRPNEAAR